MMVFVFVRRQFQELERLANSWVRSGLKVISSDTEVCIDMLQTVVEIFPRTTDCADSKHD